MYPQAVNNLINALSRLPGIGAKTAERLALHLVRAPAAEAQAGWPGRWPGWAR